MFIYLLLKKKKKKNIQLCFFIGTNDVINGYSAWDIYDGLKKLYSLCSKHGARILGVTIPEFDWVIKSLQSVAYVSDGFYLF
jgi:hypothetical protein